MRNRAIALLLAGAAGVLAQPPANDPILRAMVDELGRSRQLKLAALDEPYFIEYCLDDALNFSASATLGGLLQSKSSHFRLPRVEVRVGSYQFDNTNSIYTGLHPGVRYDSDRWPLDNNYNLLRQMFWLATDRAYKSALESIARKKAALKNLTQSEAINDFSRAKPAVKVLDAKLTPWDEPAWNDKVRGLSAIFARYPEIIASTVEVELLQSATYYLNSEGSLARYPDNLSTIRARAVARATDGTTVRDAVTFHTFTSDRLPPEVELRRGLASLAERVTQLAAAPVGESYIGPVLFEPRAAAQLFAEVLGGNLVFPRRPISEPGRPVPMPASELDGRVGSRILPEWIDVVDDPTQKEWRGRTLMGAFTLDLEGQPPMPVQVIEKGVLKDILRTRQPVRGFEGSNGHARLGGGFGAKTAFLSNLFVQARQTSTAAELKKRLIESATARNKPYAILIRTMDYPSSASYGELQRLAGSMAQSGGTTRPVSPPILVYRIYADGKEELVRGLRLRNFSVRSFRDIVAASDESVAYDFIGNLAPFSLMGAGGYVAPATVIAPAVLFEELELERPEEERPTLPVVPPPPLIAGN